MRKLERIYLVLNPELRFEGATSTHSLQVANQYDRLALELQQHSGTPVEVMERRLSDAPTDGIWIAPAPEWDDLISVSARLGKEHARPILLDLNVNQAVEFCEALRPAGVVLDMRFWAWRDRDEEGFPPFEIFGLKALAPALGSLVSPTSLKETESYCLYTARQTPTLPLLLARYVDAYWRSLYG